MPQTKYFLPKDLKTRCISYIKGYERMVNVYHEKRKDIMYSSHGTITEQPKGNKIGDESLNKVILLQKLEERYDTKIIKAIDEAKMYIGINIFSENERKKVVEAIFDSCIEGRNFIFLYRNLCISKSAFYNERQRFLYCIAKKLELI